MKNVEITVVDGKIQITVDPTVEIGPSKSGKTILIASSEGNADIAGFPGLKLGLNIFKSKNNKK